MSLDLTDRVELRSGRFLNLRDPDPRDIVLEDIAHGLSMTCRFSGQCDRFYSVAEHAVRVSYRIASVGWSPLELQLAGLHHDDSEAFVTDVPRPAKALLPDYAVLESRVQLACLSALDLAWLDWHGETIKDADDWALAQEAFTMMPSKGRFWHLRNSTDGLVRRYGWTPERARDTWLLRHEYLTRELRAIV